MVENRGFTWLSLQILHPDTRNLFCFILRFKVKHFKSKINGFRSPLVFLSVLPQFHPLWLTGGFFFVQLGLFRRDLTVSVRVKSSVWNQRKLRLELPEQNKETKTKVAHKHWHQKIRVALRPCTDVSVLSLELWNVRCCRGPSGSLPESEQLD